MITSAIIIMTLALLFYTVGVFLEKITGELRIWNLFMFWIGLILDSTGTGMMFSMTGSLTLNLHAATGGLAIFLMIFHAVWATVVLLKNNKKLRQTFHRFSFIVWLIWLVPYITGVLINI